VINSIEALKKRRRNEGPLGGLVRGGVNPPDWKSPLEGVGDGKGRIFEGFVSNAKQKTRIILLLPTRPMASGMNGEDFESWGGEFPWETA